MKVVILAGGMQSTINNEQEGVPKPMVELGGRPLIWHIMKHFSEYGVHEFIVCGGYKVDMIKEYFMDYYIYASDITVNLLDNSVEIHKKRTEDWKVTVVDTGLFSSTGQRVSLIQNYIKEDEFIVTYGDCLSDIDVNALLEKHRQSGKLVTVAMAKPTGRNQLLPFTMSGELDYNRAADDICSEEAWVNADCMVMNRKVFAYLQGNYDLEKQLFQKLSEQKMLAAYKHKGFWTPVETKRDLVNAENLWNAGIAPWAEEN